MAIRRRCGTLEHVAAPASTQETSGRSESGLACQPVEFLGSAAGAGVDDDIDDGWCVELECRGHCRLHLLRLRDIKAFPAKSFGDELISGGRCRRQRRDGCCADARLHVCCAGGFHAHVNAAVVDNYDDDWHTVSAATQTVFVNDTEQQK
jgi:hypothetical protein